MGQGRSNVCTAIKGVHVCGVKNALRTVEDRKVGDIGFFFLRKYTWVGEKCKNAGEKKYNHPFNPIFVQ